MCINIKKNLFRGTIESFKTFYQNSLITNNNKKYIPVLFQAFLHITKFRTVSNNFKKTLLKVIFFLYVNVDYYTHNRNKILPNTLKMH